MLKPAYNTIRLPWDGPSATRLEISIKRLGNLNRSSAFVLGPLAYRSKDSPFEVQTLVWIFFIYPLVILKLPFLYCICIGPIYDQVQIPCCNSHDLSDKRIKHEVEILNVYRNFANLTFPTIWKNIWINATIHSLLAFEVSPLLYGSSPWYCLVSFVVI